VRRYYKIEINDKKYFIETCMNLRKALVKGFVKYLKRYKYLPHSYYLKILVIPLKKEDFYNLKNGVDRSEGG
jgi:hypothetical protein